MLDAHEGQKAVHKNKEEGVHNYRDEIGQVMGHSGLIKMKGHLQHRYLFNITELYSHIWHPQTS